MKKLLVVDGNSILNRAYYGIRPLTAPDGTPTNAVYGFLNIMFKVFDEEKADAAIVSFDLKAPTFRHKMFDAYIDGETLKLSRLSPDGEEGYPGNLKFSVSFTLKSDNTLDIEYEAVSDADTIVNFTNHAYFNLNGALSDKTIYNHSLMIDAEAFCRGDKDCLADGTIVPVRNTDMDFRRPVLLGDILDSDYEDIAMTGGIDHNFVLSMQKGNYKKAAELYCEATGICLECYTDQPGIQVYTGNVTDYKNGKFGAYYGKHCAICLETQTFPNSTSYSYFPSPILKADEKFYSKTSYKFMNK